MPRANPVLLAAMAGLALAGCSHDRYADRRDQVTFGVGDSIASNKAIHIIDPWPRDSRTVTHGMSGEQAEAALNKMRKRMNSDDSPSQPTTLTLSPAPNAPAPKF